MDASRFVDLLFAMFLNSCSGLEAVPAHAAQPIYSGETPAAAAGPTKSVEIADSRLKAAVEGGREFAACQGETSKRAFDIPPGGRTER